MDIAETGAMVRSGGPRTPPLYGRHGREITGYRNSVFSSNRPDVKLSQPVAITADIDRYFADSAIEVIERKPAQPFFLHVNFTAGHDPYLTPDGFQPTYDPAEHSAAAEFPARASVRPRQPAWAGRAAAPLAADAGDDPRGAGLLLRRAVVHGSSKSAASSAPWRSPIR